MSARSNAVLRMMRESKEQPRDFKQIKSSKRTYEASRASRKIGFGRRGSSTVSVLMRTTGYECICESGLEANVGRILDVDPKIIDIREQTEKVRWKKGDRGAMWPDFLVTFSDGRRLILAVKPTKFGVDCDYANTVQELNHHAIKIGYADGAIWVTDSVVDDIKVRNAKTIRYAQEFFFEEKILDMVREALLAPHVRVPDLLDLHDLALEAAWYLVGQRVAVPSTATPYLDFDTILTPVREAQCGSLHFDFEAVKNCVLGDLIGLSE